MGNVISEVMDAERCTGCGACSNGCAKGAITMKRDQEGFLKFRVNEAKCTHCGLCSKSCPVINVQYANEEQPGCYAVWAQDEIRDISSLGGAFTVLANYILHQHGYVCGVVHNDDFSAKHILTQNQAELASMRGSKYVQSDTNTVYQEIREKLNQKKKVLFTGMPCQVAGLYAFLKKEYVGLYTAELICHGITSTAVLDHYKDEVLEGKDIRSLEYKKKTPWGWHAGINAEFADGTAYRQPAEEDAYFKAYLRGISKSKACAKCKFNRMPRQADLTIGDFWKISAYDKSWNDNRGTSVVLVNNDKGRRLFEDVRNEFWRSEEVPLDYAIAGNSSLIAPYKNHLRRNKFFRELGEINFEKLVEHCLESRFDVGIVGLWYGLNYGSILTYYALYCVVGQLGYDAIMINKPDFLWRPLYAEPETIANRFISKHCSVSGLHKYQEYSILNKHCGTFMVGSDVVWNYEICGREAGSFFFLDFANASKKKIAYAASFGGGYHAPESERYINQHYLQEFDAVSVREDTAVDICKENFGVQAEKVLDPVFLCNFSAFDQAADEAKLELDGSYIMTYILGGNQIQRNLILDVAETLDCPRLVNIPNPNNPKRVTEALQLEMVEQQPSVEEWLWYMKHTNFFIGDSFHGLCFAIIFRRPFLIAISKNMPSKDRFLTLLNLCGLEDRLVYLEDDNTKRLSVIKKVIDYDKVYRKLEKYKTKSLGWLRESLCEKKQEEQEVMQEVPQDDKDDYFCIAKAAYENSHGRQIVTWGDSEPFKNALRKHFGIDVPFWVARNPELVNGDGIRAFSELKGLNKSFYLVIPENSYKDADAQLIESYGFLDVKDYIYRRHRMITIKEGQYVNRKYFDVYGNSIIGNIPPRTCITMEGMNNKLTFGDQIRVNRSLSIAMNGNSELYIGSKCSFIDLRILFYGVGKTATGRVRIREGCSFFDGQIMTWKHPTKRNAATELLIDSRCTFGRNLDISVNSGKKAILGEDCMLSHDVALQVGDGHAIFDTKSGKRVNASQPEMYDAKELLILGNHVWVGKGSMLLHGTCIGTGSIVGAGSVVRKTYPNNCVVAGNPARTVKEDAAWSRNNGAVTIDKTEEAYVARTGYDKYPVSGRNVLVVGGTGFMGIELVKELLRLGNNVTIATRGRTEDNFGDEVNRVIMDIADAQSVKHALGGRFFDVVFDDLAYCSNYVKHLLSVIKCKRYVQLSSNAVYSSDLRINQKETDFNPDTYPFEWCERTGAYGQEKRMAEAAVFQKFPEVSAVTVRIPYVTSTERLFYYCKHIVGQIPMHIENVNKALTFVRDTEVGSFLPWIAAQEYDGSINLSSSGFITIQMLIDYIEKRTGKKAVIDNTQKDLSPFDGKSFSMDVSLAEQLGYRSSQIDDWFWDLLDTYIKRAVKG